MALNGLKNGICQGIKILLTSCAITLAFALTEAVGQEPLVAVAVSDRIRPYMEALEGLHAAFEDIDVKMEVFWLDGLDDQALANLGESFLKRPFDLFVAVGPDAVRFIWQNVAADHTAKVYTLILNPEKLIDNGRDACGISLQIPIANQVEAIRRHLPVIHRLGVLFNPAFNRQFFEAARVAAEKIGIRIIPLEISSKKEIPALLKRNWKNLDGIWLIPDATVISVSIVQYIIKHSLIQKKPVIGYNDFFCESGAAMAFRFDYKDIGRQTGLLALRLMSTRDCLSPPPFFNVRINSRVMGKMGIPAFVPPSMDDSGREERVP